MPIDTADLKLYKSSTVNDTDSNGGVMSTTEVADAVKNNVWPDVPQAERVSGSVKYRKTFIKVANDSDIPLVDARIFIETYTPGDDTIVLMSGTQTDTQAQADDYSRFYGAGPLNANVSIGASTIAVNVESGNASGGANIFQNGDLIRISDKANVASGTGSVEFLRLHATTGVSWNGDLATLTFEAGTTLANAYATATPTRVASVLEAGTIQGSLTGWGESSSSGTYDETTYPLVLDSIGSIEQTWTITFTSATNFSCVGNTVGSVGSGTISGSFAPNNAAFSKPYFTLSNAGWGGTWASGETVSFTTHPAAMAVWQRRTVPAGASSLSGDKVIIAISGESA